jgi:flagellar secretion chaperone FliS
MTMMSALASYKSVQVKTSSPGEILVMLFDGLFRFMDEAAAAIRADDRARTGDRIDRAHAILSELAATLNKAAAPELCENLEALYFFCMNRLVEANLFRDAERIAECRRVLDPVRDGFKIAVRETQGGGSK